MITGKIKSLFVFIEFLHSNINNFNNYNNLINELELLHKERHTLSPDNNYKDKIKYNEIQAELENKFNSLQNNTANLIKAKAKTLNVCNFDKEPNYSFNGIETDIQQLKDNFINEELAEIFKHKNLYIEYRTTTHKNFLSLEFFFDELDELTKSLFDFFKDKEQNEFEAFEKKKIEINSFIEPFASHEQKNNKFVFATPLNETKLKILEQLADKLFFQIDQIAGFEFKGKIYTNVKQKNNDSILTPENWDQYKDIFFEQRMTQYKESYTISEKLKLELETVEKLPINKTDYKILIDRYKDYLVNKTKTKTKTQQTENEASDLNTNPFPLVFINIEVYNCFLNYKKHIIDFYTDYSYLKKRLEKLKLMHKHTDNDFMTFLLNDLKFIKQKEFEDYSIKYESKLKSLQKSHSEQRENNFNNVFESFV